MKLRSPISLELVRQGFIRGSKEFKAAYQRELRKRNKHLREREKIKWKQYYAKKQIESGGEWNKNRANSWRYLNPGKAKEIQDRATKNGVHKRFYEKNREKILKEKCDYGKRQRRKNPAFGCRSRINEARKTGNIGELIETLRNAVNKLD